MLKSNILDYHLAHNVVFILPKNLERITALDPESLGITGLIRSSYVEHANALIPVETVLKKKDTFIAIRSKGEDLAKCVFRNIGS